MNEQTVMSIITAILLSRAAGPIGEADIRDAAYKANIVIREVAEYGSNGNG